MESKRSDNRRRRVLLDEAVQQSAVSPEGGESATPPKRRRSNHYSARDAHLLKTSDLVPTRVLSLATISCGWLLAVGLVNLLDWLTTTACSGLDYSVHAAFQLASPNGLAAWVIGFAWLLASMFCLQTFAMRRHRRDDYRGTYRIWIVFSLVCLFGSVQSIVPIDRVAEFYWSKTFPSLSLSPGGIGRLSVKLVITTALFFRLLLEIRQSRSALVLANSALLIFAFLTLIDIPAIAAAVHIEQLPRVRNNLPLLGAVVLLTGIIAYSRFVCLDASGLIQQVRKRSRKRKSRVRRSRHSRSRISRLSPARPQPISAAESFAKTTASSPSRPATGPTAADPRNASRSGPLRSKIEAMQHQPEVDDADDSWDDDEQDLESPSGGGRLSKAERRRLKKLHRRQRNAA